MSRTPTTEVSLEIIRPVAKEDEQPIVYTDRDPAPHPSPVGVSKARSAVIIATLTGTTVVSSFSNGLLTIVLPRMARDISLPVNLLLWPASVYP